MIHQSCYEPTPLFFLDSSKFGKIFFSFFLLFRPLALKRCFLQRRKKKQELNLRTLETNFKNTPLVFIKFN